MRRLVATAACALTLCGAAPDYSDLYALKGAPDGAYPGGPITADRAGNLYGVTEQGGTADNGAIYELSPPPAGQTQWTEQVLFSIPLEAGSDHTSGVAFRGPHELVATSIGGGPQSCGAILTARLDQTPSVRLLYQFGSHPGDGCYPTSAPLPGRDGTLYGVTGAGGARGLGTVYALKRGDTRSPVIWDFSGQDGSQPGGSPLIGPDGALYGTTYSGGSAGFGTVWALTQPTGLEPKWTRTVVWQFKGAPDCAAPSPGTLARDAHGNLFGACQAGGAWGYGGVFEISPAALHPGPWTGPGKAIWTGRMIADSDADTGIITSGLVFSRDGRLLATSRGIGDGRSRVIAITPPINGDMATISTLWRFPAATAISPVLIGPRGILFGTTATGGAWGAGTIWSLAPQ